MQYLKISNIGEITKNQIELLGFSNKRSDSRLIGEKGSGIKFTRLQAMRQGIGFWICTKDFKNRIEKVPIDKENVGIQFVYEDREGKIEKAESSYTLEAGFGDWTQDWFIVREVFQNARDENVRHGELTEKEAMEWVIKSCEIVDEIDFAKDGNTSVYISVNQGISQVFTDLKKYFVYDPIFSCDHGCIYERPENQKNSYYKGGIFIEDDSYESAYNYDCKNISLTESRMLKDKNDFYLEALKILSEAPVQFKRSFMRNAFDNFKGSEINCVYSWQADQFRNIPAWVEAFYSEFGESSVIHKTNTVNDYQREKVEMSGKFLICLPETLYIMLERGGVKTLEEICSSKSSFKYKIHPKTKKTKELIKEAQKLLEPYFHKTEDIFLFDPISEEQVNTAGVYLPRDNKILLNKNKVSSLDEMLPILVEEYIHKDSGAKDGSRAFQDYSVSKTAEILLKEKA